MNTDVLAQKIDEKLQVLQQLYHLSLRQSEVLDSGDFSGLMRILGAKGRLLAVMQDIEQQLDPFRHENPDERKWNSDAQRALCRQRSAECESILKQIVLTERQSEELLIRHRDEAATQLGGAHVALAARAAYRPSQSTGHAQLDLSSESGASR